MNQKILFTFLLFLFAAYSSVLLAGTGMGMGPPNPPCGSGPFPPCPQTVPIDGGITLLVGAGIAMGARKFMKKK